MEPHANDRTDATLLLQEAMAGDGAAAECLLPLVYDQLRELAARHFRRQSPGHTLEPTALVHEVFLKMIDQSVVDYNGRTHFMAVAAMAMQQVLIDHARRKRADKRGGGRASVTLLDGDVASEQHEADVLALQDALARLASMDERKGQVVSMRFLGGMSIEQTADLLGVARSTVAEDWRFARAWLIRELRGADAPESGAPAD